MNDDKKAKLLLEKENYDDLDFIRACVELGGKEFAIEVAPRLAVSMMTFYYIERGETEMVMKSKVCHRDEFLDILMENKIQIVG